MELFKKYKTPFYLFDIDELNNRIKYLKSKLSNNINLCYAVKANTFIIDYVVKEVSRLEICSPGEYEICKHLNVDPTKMVISGVYKEEKFIKSVINQENTPIFTIESLSQYELLKKLSKDKRIKVLIRLTSGNQFGVSEEDAFKILHEDKTLDIIGIEYFSGTQKKSLKKIEREFNYIREFINRVKKECNRDIKELEYGSGFPFNYYESSEFDEDTFLESFNSLINEYFRDVKLTIELGRSIAASCGMYYTSVVDIKKNEVGSYAIVDGGMNHLVYYGAMMGMNTPIHEVIPTRVGNKEKWCICGSLCTINDILVKEMSIANLKINDIIVFKNTGAYSMTEGISLFLSRDLPKIIIKSHDNYNLVRKNVKTSILNMPK